MSLQLSNDDRCAIDLLLDRDGGAASATTTPAGLNNCFSVNASSVLQERIAKVETLLRVLDNHAPEEPPADLAARTVERCDRAAQAKATHAHQAHVAAATRPLA